MTEKQEDLNEPIWKGIFRSLFKEAIRMAPVIPIAIVIGYPPYHDHMNKVLQSINFMNDPIVVLSFIGAVWFIAQSGIIIGRVSVKKKQKDTWDAKTEVAKWMERKDPDWK